jgi:hypothetical protein
VRQRIYRDYFIHQCRDCLLVEPIKKGGYYINDIDDGPEIDITSIYSALILLSKQFYLDLIYNFYGEIGFVFNNFHAFRSYTQVIHPLKLEFIEQLRITLVGTSTSNPFAPAFFRGILTLKSLRDLSIHVICDRSLWEIERRPVNNEPAYRRVVGLPYIYKWERAQWEQLQQLEKLDGLGFTFQSRDRVGRILYWSWRWGHVPCYMMLPCGKSFSDTICRIVWLGRDYDSDDQSSDLGST